MKITNEQDMVFLVEEIQFLIQSLFYLHLYPDDEINKIKARMDTVNKMCDEYMTNERRKHIKVLK